MVDVTFHNLFVGIDRYQDSRVPWPAGAFPRPSNGRIAVKVINHLGDEVIKVFRG